MPKISALPLAVTPTGDDVAVIVQGGVTKKTPLSAFPLPDLVVDALALKAPLASPALTGIPTAPTAATTTSTTQLATTAFVQQELAAGGSTARALVVSVRNQSGGTMTAGTVVYINGATGNLPTIAKAIATSDATSAQTIGLVQTSIANNGMGLVVVRGIAGNLDTSALTEGQQLYLSPSVAGAYTTTKQYAPNHLVYIGIVTRAHPTQGSIEVAVQNGFEMDELHDVSAQSPNNGDTLRWNSSTSLWEKSALGTLATQSGTFTDKANLASPTFTGNPLAPTPATTDNDTSIATTAMVQAVANAQWTQPTALAITAAGNSNVAAATAQNRYLTQRVNVTAFTGTATVTLQSASAIAGDKRRLIVAMPAGFANLIELRNLTSGGTLLATVPMDGALARTWVGYSTFDGTNWGAVSFSPMSVDEFVLSRTAFRGDYIQSDGATSNRAAGIYGPFDATNNPREYVAGAATLTIPFTMTVPTSAWSQATVFAYSSSTITGFNNLPYTLGALGNGDILYIEQRGASSTLNYRSFSMATFRSVYSGQTIFGKITFTQGTANPVVEVNGVNISASFSLASLTPPAWLDAAMVPTYRLVGYNWPAGPAPIVTPILGATSAADDAFYMQTGKWPAWVVAGGSCSGQTSGTLTIGKQYIIHSYVASDVFTNVGAASNATGIVFTATGTTPTTWTNSTVIRPLGALSAPSVQPINVIDDVSGTGGNQGRLLGCTAVTDKTTARICANTWLASNQRILEGTLFDNTQFAISGPITQVTTGTPTTTIGSVSAGVQYKASSALAAGANPALPVTYKLATGEIWVGSGTAVNVRTTIPLVKIQ